MRQFFESAIQQTIQLGNDISFAMAVFDLNNLKMINDTYGHEAGDKYLINGCRLICKHFKSSPVYRIG